MKVILRKDVGGVGQKDTLREVSDGYALNFLIPKGLAEQATPKKIAELEARKKGESEGTAKRELEWATNLKKLEGTSVTISVKANETGRLYKELKGDDIVGAIAKEHSAAIPPSAVIVNPIKQTGDFKAKIRLGKHEAGLTIRVVAS